MKLFDIIFESVLDMSEVNYSIASSEEIIKRLEDKFKNDTVILSNGSVVPRYDFSKLIYKGGNKPITFYCNKIGKDGNPHGFQYVSQATTMLNGSTGCRVCSKKLSIMTFKHSQEKFIEKAEEKWGKGTYDYSNLKYNGSEEPVDIICHKKKENGEEHGPFRINRAQWFISKKNPMYCPDCTILNKKILRSGMARTREDFIKKAEEKWGKETFDYSKLTYNGSEEPVTNIICHKLDDNGVEHGPFSVKRAQHFLNNTHCNKCAQVNKSLAQANKSLTKQEFLDRARNLHQLKNGKPKYTYEKVENLKIPLIHSKQEVIVTCPNHGDFSIIASYHLYNRIGCTLCSTSKGEDDMMRYLFTLGYDTIYNKTFDDCTNSWKGLRCYKYKFDAYSEELNTVFEFDGEYHFLNVRNLPEQKFKLRVLDDRVKNQYCRKRGIKLVRIAYTDMKDIKGQIDKALKSNKMLWLSDNYPTDKGWRDKSIRNKVDINKPITESKLSLINTLYENYNKRKSNKEND